MDVDALAPLARRHHSVIRAVFILIVLLRMLRCFVIPGQDFTRTRPVASMEVVYGDETRRACRSLIESGHRVILRTTGKSIEGKNNATGQSPSAI
jgi:hypothetical protein